MELDNPITATSDLATNMDSVMHPELVALQEEIGSIHHSFLIGTDAISNNVEGNETLTDDQLLDMLLGSEEESAEENNFSSSSDSETEPEDFLETECPGWSLREQKKNEFPFTERCGLENETGRTPMDFFDMLFTSQFLVTLLNNINRYAEKWLSDNQKRQARITRWKNINMTDLRVFLGLLFHMGTIKVNRIEDYWSTEELFAINIFGKCMSRTKFLLILRCLNFTYNNDTSRLCKISGLVDFFNNIMSAVFKPDRILCIDESLVLWRGRLWCRQYMKGKASKYGIKLYLLTDQFGCVLKIVVYGGKCDALVGGRDHVQKVVKVLLQNSLGMGHSVYMDNYYNSVSLTNFLIENKTHVTGTMRPNRQGLPLNLKQKKLNTGDKISIFSDSGICLTKWKDRREVLAISSEHNGDWKEYTTSRNETKSKPNLIFEYNKYMGGVDKHDQMMSYYNPEHKTLRWYKKLGIHILGTLLCNAHNLYNRFGEKPMPLYDYRLSIIRSLVSSQNNNCVPPSIQQSHTSFLLPRDENNRIKRKRCVVCWRVLKKRVDTAHYCPACPKQPGLCLGNCFIKHHKKD